jgi:hypothetical protein
MGVASPFAQAVPRHAPEWAAQNVFDTMAIAPVTTDFRGRLSRPFVAAARNGERFAYCVMRVRVVR